jgi:hypothetical protein
MKAVNFAMPPPQVNPGEARPPIFPGLAREPQTYPDIEKLKALLVRLRELGVGG